MAIEYVLLFIGLPKNIYGMVILITSKRKIKCIAIFYNNNLFGAFSILQPLYVFTKIVEKQISLIIVFYVSILYVIVCKATTSVNEHLSGYKIFFNSLPFLSKSATIISEI